MPPKIKLSHLKKHINNFYIKNREKNKYFQIVNIGNKNTPVLIIGTGKKEAVNGKTYFNNCKVYTFSDNHIKQMETFQNYGGRFISLKKRRENIIFATEVLIFLLYIL